MSEQRCSATREQETLRRVDDERLRISRETHDAVAHAMSAINVQAGIAMAGVGESYASLIAPFVLARSGIALVFAPAANAVLSSVRTDQAGQGSGATNAIRELGGVLGVAVLATVFTSHGGYGSDQSFVDGLILAMWVGTGVLGAGAVIAATLPFSTRAAATTQAKTEAAAREDPGRGRPDRPAT